MTVKGIELEADVPEERTVPKKAKRRRFRILTWVGGALTLAIGGMALLFAWSASEHDRLMSEVTEVDESGLTKDVIFAPDTGEYDLFRTPAIVVTKEGHLLALAEGRRGDSDWTGVEIVSRRSEDLGKTWGPIETVYEEPQAAIGSPTPVLDEQTGTIWLAIRKSLTREPHETFLLLSSSDDGGRTWSQPIDMTDRAGYPSELSREEDVLPGPGHGIQLRTGKHAGRLLIPTTSGRDSKISLRLKKVFESQVLMSDDHGHSWRYSKPTDYGGENTIAEWTDGSVLMFIRNRGWPNEVGFKRYTISYDGGNTWEPTTLTQTEMKEPVCHAKLFFHETGGPSGEPAFLFMQPDVDAKGRWDKTSRRKLTVFVSTDGGETWPIHRIAHEGTASYSDLDLIDEHTLASVFEIGAGEEKEWGGQVVFARMPLSWVLEGTGYEPPQPFSEKVFDFYTTLRAPVENWWKE